ncbi:MAG: transketolase family protein [Actinobacteria bacterium]|nr:transketolase family protein [Actinomycetota bacterium]
MKDLKSTRVALGDALLELADSGLDVVAVAADTSKSMTVSILKDKYPDRIYDCGIAEQNMIMISAGLASTGKIVFATSYSTFTSMRVLEQLRTFVCYPNLNVKIFAGMGGFSGGIEGATHMALEDLGIVRCIPNLVILNPADYYSTKKAVIEAAKIKSPCYIRVGRDATQVLFGEDYKFSIGKANLLINDANDFGLVASGTVLGSVMEAARKLKDNGYDFKLLEMPTLKPIDAESIINLAKKTKRIFTIEEHNITGGLYSAVCEVLCRDYPAYVYPIATHDIFGESGTPAELARKYKLDTEGIYDQIETVLKTGF